MSEHESPAIRRVPEPDARADDARETRDRREAGPATAVRPDRPANARSGGAAGDAAAGPGQASIQTPVQAADAEPVRPSWFAPLLTVGIVLAALNLRPAITSLGALLEETRDGLGMSGSVAGVLTSVPPLCFAIFGVAAPRLARRFGPAAVVCAGMAAITAGLAVRPFADGTAVFLAASALTLAGIALTNVLLPVIVKRWFPDRVGSMTGLYSMAMALGTSAAAAVTVPMTGAMGGNWRAGLGLWAVLAAVAVVPWLPIARETRRRGAGTDQGSRAAKSGGRAERRPERRAGRRADGGDLGPNVLRSRTAWALACYFGFQATSAYITMGWMPQIFRDAGVSAGQAGLLLALTMVMGVPLAFVIPRLASRLPNQGVLVAGLGAFGLAGYAGLLLAPAAGAWAWAFLLGVSNCAFPLAITMIGLRARSAAGMVKLSAFAQSTGYLISIPGPLLVGVLYQRSGSWGLPIALMAALMVPQILFGIRAGRNRHIEDEAAGGGRRMRPVAAAD
ncbi:CynX/NimT family MFS transporter [Yinghuangia soli]|uniref:MFS transporter n=1 Tax=Yinghuangia soli TaxID=2908204 RepID=A0AA41Q0B3_9ACTN|nr:MFS transporter [Yinghuangia soli]MCF2527712.1 MFS transporter [Yinghuangia soli]